METVLIDYGAGNLRSAAKGFERMAAETGYGGDIVVTSDAARVRRADRLVLPGDGAFGDCMRGVLGVPGLREALQETVIEKGRPFLGICIGMQLMAERGLEHGVHQGLGWVKGEVAFIERDDTSLKIPHMGWNQLDIQQTDHPVLKGLADASSPVYGGSPAKPGRGLVAADSPPPSLRDASPASGGGARKPYAYFLHSYHLTKAAPGQVLATTDHGGPVVAIVGRDNMIGTQFHPEKSQKAGLKLLANFLSWCP